MGVCCGEEGRCVLRRGLFALDGYIVNDRTKQHETATLMEINQLGAKRGGVQSRVELCLHDGYLLTVTIEIYTFVAQAGNPGMGLVAMRERAELLGGTIEFMKPSQGGTLVRLKVPREKLNSHAE